MLYNILDWLRCYLPWTTRGELKERIDTAIRERNYALVCSMESDRARAEVERENQKLKNHLVQERVATRRLMVGLFNGLEGTLTNLGDFIDEMPDYAPQSDEQRRVFIDLTKSHLQSEDDERRRRRAEWGC